MEARGISTVFVNNIPPLVHWRWLWNIFQNHGRVADVFIPRKRSSSGRKFGFVRFYDWREAARAVSRLNGAWLWEFKLGVNMARFNTRSNFWRKVNISNNENIEKANGGNVHNGCVGEDSSEQGTERRRVGPQNKSVKDGGKIGLDSGVAKVEMKSYLQAVQGGGSDIKLKPLELVSGDSSKVNVDKDDNKSVSSSDSVLEGLKTCIGEVDNEAIHRLERCVIGTARDYYETRTIMENFRMSGVFDITAKKISGKQFLLEFEEEEVRDKMEESNWVWLKEWFVEIEPWTVYSYAKYRITWLTVFGVPLHVWNQTTFKNIASIWGEFVSFDGKTLEFKDFSRGSMLIMTNQLKKINDVIILKCGSEDFPVRVTEVGDDVVSLFHCCHDSYKAKMEVQHAHSGYDSDPDGSMEVEQVWFSDSIRKNKTEKLGTGDTVPETTGVELELCMQKVTKVNDLCSKSVEDGGPLNRAIMFEEGDRACLNNNVDNLVLNSLGSGGPCRGEGCNEGTNLSMNGRQSKEQVMENVDQNNMKKFKGRSKSCLSEEEELNNKRGAKSIVEIEDKIIDDLYKKGRRRGRKKKNIFRDIQVKNSDNKIVNASLSDSDFTKRMKVLREESRKTWDIGKKLGLSATCDDDLVIEELMRISNRDND
ncbi:hypothetical protein REPUB_Repub12eG0150900 [Reevesia pubescens]